MIRALLAVFFLLMIAFSSGWHLRAQQQQFSPSEIAIAITSNVNALASALENANRQVKALTEKNTELQKQLDDLKPTQK